MTSGLNCLTCEVRVTNSMKNVNERWTTWEETITNLLNDNCPPYHFSKDCKATNLRGCNKCWEKYIKENRNIFNRGEIKGE